MSIKSKYKLYVKGENEQYNIEQIISKLPDNRTITKQVLEKLNNKTTKMVSDEDIKGNYYVFLNDTIYLSSKNTNKYNRLTVICHECIHSMQNKTIQWINFILSNLEIIVFVIFSILKLLNIFENILTYTYIAFVIVSIIPRFILEIHASLKSIKYTKEYVSKNIGNEEAEFVNKIVKFQVIALLPVMLFTLCFWKIIRILILCII